MTFCDSLCQELKAVNARLRAELEALRAQVESADKTVSALHTLLWDSVRQTPKVDGANDLIWLLHDTLRGATRRE